MLLTATEEGIPIQILIDIAAREVAGRAQVGARLDSGEEQRQPLRREDAVPSSTGRTARLSARYVEPVGPVVLGQKIVRDGEVKVSPSCRPDSGARSARHGCPRS